jgi:tetratricopeptide (TPR) repeat protein
LSRPDNPFRVPDDPLKGARDAVRTGRFREALTELAQLESVQGTSAEWLLLKAMACWRLGDFAESHQASQNALAAYKDRGDGDGEMRALNVAAAGKFALGELDAARTGFERALELARRYGDKLMMARCANNLGNVAYYYGDHTGALHHYAQAARLFEQLGSLSGTAEAWHNTAVVLREQGRLSAAQEAADKAMDAAQRLGDPRTLGWTLGGSGETDAMQGDLRLGWARAERAAELAREHYDRLTEIDSMRILAYIARSQGQGDRAVDLARTAATLARETDSPWMLAKAHQELGYSLREVGMRRDADEALAVAADAFERTGARSRATALRSAQA